MIHSFGLIWFDIELRIHQGSSLSCWFLRHSGGGFMESLILFLDSLIFMEFYGLSHLFMEFYGLSHLVYGLSQFQRRQTASADERWSIRELSGQ